MDTTSFGQLACCMFSYKVITFRIIKVKIAFLIDVVDVHAHYACSSKQASKHLSLKRQGAH